MESHLEMVAANERAFQIMMEGFEQLESIVHAHDQLIQDRDEHAQIVWSAQEALIRDRKGRSFFFESNYIKSAFFVPDFSFDFLPDFSLDFFNPIFRLIFYPIFRWIFLTRFFVWPILRLKLWCPQKQDKHVAIGGH